MIWLVAEPLLESASDYESKQMTSSLAALAWNFTLLDPTAQEGDARENSRSVPMPRRDGRCSFTSRTVRLRLFPEENRVICKVETEPALYGDVTVRVASAM